MQFRRMLSCLLCMSFALSFLPLSGKVNDEFNPLKIKRLSRDAFNRLTGFHKIICKKQIKKGGREEFEHHIQLQLFDSLDVPVEGTQFWVTAKILREGRKVTISLPAINFQTGPASAQDPYNPFPGGTIRTTDGFLPKRVRPLDPIFRTFFGPTNDGQSLAFSYTDNPLPNPIAGFNLGITLAGGLVIQGAGTWGSLIPPGGHVLMPTDITYFVESTEQLCKNFVLSEGATDITQFTGGPDGPAGSAYRDHHINDAFDDVVAWTWTDNSMIADKSNNTVNVMVRIGKMKGRKLKLRKPIQLTDLPAGIFAWDTAVAINPTNKDNIVVSYAIGNIPSTPSGKLHEEFS